MPCIDGILDVISQEDLYTHALLYIATAAAVLDSIDVGVFLLLPNKNEIDCRIQCISCS